MLFLIPCVKIGTPSIKTSVPTCMHWQSNLNYRQEMNFLANLKGSIFIIFQENMPLDTLEGHKKIFLASDGFETFGGF